jgi:hypothetical protein
MAARVTSPAASHLPVLRQRPSGTSVYSTPIRIAARKVTCVDGMAQPPQPAWMTTPNGRGRWATAPSTFSASKLNSCARITTTISCRNRRSTNNASSSPHNSPLRTHQELIAASARQTPTSPGACSPVSHLTTASSATVTSTARPRSPRANTATVSATSTAAAISHRTPLVCR